MTTPRVSIAMTVYNAGRYFEPAVRSLLDQTYGDFELVIVNDGSTDGSGGLADTWAQRDTRVRVIHQDNGGIAAAANRACAACEGEFLARMDSDDVALPNRLERQVAFLDDPANAEVVAVGGSVIFIDSEGRELTTIHNPTDDASIQAALLKGHCSIWQTGVMMRMDAKRQVGDYNPEVSSAEDHDLWLRLGEVGRLANVPEPLMQYRLHASSVSERKGDEQRRRCRMACEAAWKRRGIEGTFEASGRWRPGPERSSRAAFAAKYGWWAYNSGHADTARSYGLQAVQLAPFKMPGWRLLRSAWLRPGQAGRKMPTRAATSAGVEGGS